MYRRLILLSFLFFSSVVSAQGINDLYILDPGMKIGTEQSESGFCSLSISAPDFGSLSGLGMVLWNLYDKSEKIGLIGVASASDIYQVFIDNSGAIQVTIFDYESKSKICTITGNDLTISSEGTWGYPYPLVSPFSGMNFCKDFDRYKMGQFEFVANAKLVISCRISGK